MVILNYLFDRAIKSPRPLCSTQSNYRSLFGIKQCHCPYSPYTSALEITRMLESTQEYRSISYLRSISILYHNRGILRARGILCPTSLRSRKRGRHLEHLMILNRRASNSRSSSFLRSSTSIPGLSSIVRSSNSSLCLRSSTNVTTNSSHLQLKYTRSCLRRCVNQTCFSISLPSQASGGAQCSH